MDGHFSPSIQGRFENSKIGKLKSRKLKYHTCLGLADGLMTIGGEDFDGFQRINDIWLLRDSDWNLVGTLKQVLSFSTPSCSIFTLSKLGTRHL